MRVSAVELHELAADARPIALARERVVPVAPSLASLFPEGGLRRGSIVAASGSTASTSLGLALVAAASKEGSWCAAVGVGRPALGLAAAAEFGIALDRFPVVAAGAGSGPGGWAWAVAALLDAFDIVLTWPPRHVRSIDARRLAARSRERGAVLLVAGGEKTWPEPVDVHLQVLRSEWQGVEWGHGRLEARQVEVASGGRRAAARERRVVLQLPPPPESAPLVSCTRRDVNPVISAQITSLQVHENVTGMHAHART